MPLQHTQIVRVGDNPLLKLAVAKLLPHLNWRHHGIGVLQAYLHEGRDYEARVHIWASELELPGIEASGNAHNHRFHMTSTVLCGALLHTEYQLVEGNSFEFYDFVHARLQTEDTRDAMRKLDAATGAVQCRARIGAGDRYSFERGAFHSTHPLSDIAVSLVEKTDQIERKAQVLAPTGLQPVPAFGGNPLPEQQLQEILDRAAAWLRQGT